MVASMTVPVSMYWSRDTSRSTTMMAPVPLRESRVTASPISSATARLLELAKKLTSRERPSRASACRSSGWNTTIAAKAPYVNTTPSRVEIMFSLSTSATK